jgi:hypothetical protein
MQSQARGEERHQGLDEKWEAQNAWLLLGVQRQDVPVSEGVKEPTYYYPINNRCRFPLTSSPDLLIPFPSAVLLLAFLAMLYYSVQTMTEAEEVRCKSRNR